MANADEIKKGNKALKDQATEVTFLQDAFRSLGEEIVSSIEAGIDAMDGLDTISKKVAKSFQNDIAASIKKISKDLEGNVAIQLKINKGDNAAKDIQKKREELEARRAVTLAKIEASERLGAKAKKEAVAELENQFKGANKSLDNLEEQNKERQKSKGLTDLLSGSLSKAADKIDESGTLSMILKGNLKEALTLNRLGELAMLAFATAALQASKNIAEIAKTQVYHMKLLRDYKKNLIK